MKLIPKLNLPDATVLTPMDMNAIHFETGDHTPVNTPSTTTTPQATSKP